MTDRIQKALDDELPREALGPAEREELDAYEEAMDEALAGVRAEAAPDVTRAVMARIAALPGHGARRDPVLKRVFDWLWAPRPFAVRPAWGLAAAALLIVLLIPGVFGDGIGRTPAPVASPADGSGATAADPALEPARVFVHFRLDAAEAQSVQLAADFTGWEPTYSLNETAPGVWTVVVPVSAGVHQYAFVVDGDRWVADPLAPAVDDGFGGSNSRLDVVTPEPTRAL